MATTDVTMTARCNSNGVIDTEAMERCDWSAFRAPALLLVIGPLGRAGPGWRLVVFPDNDATAEVLRQ